MRDDFALHATRPAPPLHGVVQVAQEDEMKPRTMYSRVSIEADLDSLAKSRQATGVVLRALRDRLTPEEGRQAVAQLPRELKGLWRADAAPGLPVKMHRREFVDRVQREAGLPSRRRAEMLVDAVFAALKEQLSPGEADDIGAQLPTDLKGVWARA
jgi:uncharacterized protein (DUF2267 family)